MQTFKKIIFCLPIFMAFNSFTFSQENQINKVALGASSLYPENQKFNREFSIYGEYYFSNLVGIGIKSAFENQQEDLQQKQNNKYFIYALVKTPLSKDNDFVFLKPYIGGGYMERDKKFSLNVSLEVNFYLIKELLYSGIVSSSYIIPGTGTRIYSGINLGVSF